MKLLLVPITKTHTRNPFQDQPTNVNNPPSKTDTQNPLKDRLNALLRCSVKLGLRPITAPMLSQICSEAEEKLFKKIISNPRHLLHPLLLARRESQYMHSESELTNTHSANAVYTSSKKNNYIVRMLYKTLDVRRLKKLKRPICIAALKARLPWLLILLRLCTTRSTTTGTLLLIRRHRMVAS